MASHGFLEMNGSNSNVVQMSKLMHGCAMGRYEGMLEDLSGLSEALQRRINQSIFFAKKGNILVKDGLCCSQRGQ